MYRGRYINLDRNPQRRSLIEENLRQAGVADRYQRFAGVDGREASESRQTALTPGFLGNWLSHERLVGEHKGQGNHLHVLEDDALLPVAAGSLLDDILARADTEIPDWDILFTEIIPAVETKALFALAEYALPFPLEHRIGFVPLDSMDFAGTSSYFLSGRSVDKYLSVIQNQWTAGIPIDLYLRGPVHSGQLKAYVTSPFLTTVSEASSSSDITGPHDFSHALLDLYRRSFYFNANQEALLAQVQNLTRGARASMLASIFLHVHFGVLSDRWKEL